jgi:uncharacterized membrane protein
MNWFPMHSWHPVAVHLPLVALVLAAAFDQGALRNRSVRWRDAATVLWWLGLLGAATAVTTGLIAYNRVEHSELGHEVMTLHRNLALVTVAILLVAAVWRWRRPFARGAALLGLLGALGLGWVGYLGGELVFRHAIGLPTETLDQVMHERGGHSHHGEAPDSLTGAQDRGHQHPPPTSNRADHD